MHLAVSQSNISIMESTPVPAWYPEKEEPESAIIGEPKVIDGYIKLADSPGLGVNVDNEKLSLMTRVS